MSKFAKLFRIGKYQVLVTKNCDSEKEEFIFTQTTHIACWVNLTISHEDENKIDKLFDEYDITMATIFLNKMIKQFGE